MYIRALAVIAFFAIALPSTALPNIADVGEPAARLERRASCSNKNKTTTNMNDPYCLPANSKGFRSSHNCASKVKGKSYLCVQRGVATCYHANLAKLNFENGECFL